MTSPEIPKSPEKGIAPEIPRTPWETLIVIQRHGRYDNRPPKDPDNPTKEEMTYGHLTEQGRVEAREKALERIEAILEQDPENTDFLLVNSPTFWWDSPQLGQRALETAEIISETIVEELGRRGLDETQLLNTASNIKGERSRPDERLGEALMFQVPEFTKFLRKQYGGMGPDFWINFERDTHKEVREQMGAEGPVEIANRVNQVVNVVARFARIYQIKHPGRKLVAWMVTHGDGLGPYTQRVLGVPEEDFEPDYNAAVSIAVNAEGQGTVAVNDKEYDAGIVQSGKPAPIT